MLRNEQSNKSKALLAANCKSQPFDVLTMIAVEIPTPLRAGQPQGEVLCKTRQLSFTELFVSRFELFCSNGTIDNFKFFDLAKSRGDDMVCKIHWSWKHASSGSMCNQTERSSLFFWE